MAYSDKFGITDFEQLPGYRPVATFGISWDIDGDFDRADDRSLRYPCFLIVPDKEKQDHHHVALSRTGAKDLRDWLSAFLKDIGVE